MRRIIHLSDFHVGHADLGDRFKAVVSNIIFEKGDKPEDYVIVFTGDFVEDAHDQARYDEVRSTLDILHDAGFNKLLITPGNHDYGTGDHGDKRFVKVFKNTFFGQQVEYPEEGHHR